MFSTIRITIKIRTGLLYLRNSTPPSARHKLDREVFLCDKFRKLCFGGRNGTDRKIDSGKYQLADQNPPQISLHTDHGNGKKYEQEPDQKADHVGEKDPPRHSQPLQNAGERGIQIQKGQMNPSVTMKCPASSLWNNSVPIQSPRKRKPHRQRKPMRLQYFTVRRVSFHTASRSPFA